MIDAAKSDQALHALHHFLIHARSMAYEGYDGACIAGVLDWAELLPRFRDAVAMFDRPDPARW